MQMFHVMMIQIKQNAEPIEKEMTLISARIFLEQVVKTQEEKHAYKHLLIAEQLLQAVTLYFMTLKETL